MLCPVLGVQRCLRASWPDLAHSPRRSGHHSDPEQSHEAHEGSWNVSKAGLVLRRMYRVRFLVPMVWVSSLGLPNVLELDWISLAVAGYLASHCQTGTDWTLKRKLAGNKALDVILVPTHGTHVVVTVKLVTTKPIIPGAKQPLSGPEWCSLASMSLVLVDSRRYLASAGPFCWNRGEA